MDKLEQYLDQACRGIGGPRSMRQHIRRELRGHLRDAIAEHRAAGMTEDEALERALADFGGPEQVGSELIAQHGHRFMTVAIDKAMQWKEKTLKAKWLWMTLIHVALLAVIAVEALFITFAVGRPLYILLYCKAAGHISVDDLPHVLWLIDFAQDVASAWNSAIWWLPPLAVLWGLFEWRVRSEHKSLVRLSALGTAAIALTLVVVVMAGALSLPYMTGIISSSIARPFARETIVLIDESIAAVEEAMEAEDWKAVQKDLQTAKERTHRFDIGPTLDGVSNGLNPPMGIRQSREELRGFLNAAQKSLQEAALAAYRQDMPALETAMKRFHDAYDPLRRAVKETKQ